MAELDLSKAVEAIRDIFEDRAAFIAVPPNADLSEEEILTAALPHILDALARETEATAIILRGQMDERRHRIGTVTSTDVVDLHAAESAGRYLRAKGRQLRNG